MILPQRLFFKIGIIIVLVVVFFFYAFFKAQTFLTGPKIEIEFPKNGEVVQNSDLEIAGTAKNISLLYLNGRQIFVDNQSRFKENLLLAKGYNIIEISAKDKFSREIKELREIVLK